MGDARQGSMVEIALLALLAFLWGSSYLLIKLAVETIPPVTLIAARVTVAAILLSAVVVWSGERLPKDRQTWQRLLLQAFFNSIGAWTVLAWGQQYIDSGLASVLNSTSPIFVFFITLLITRHEATNARRLLGACIGLAGVILIVGIDALESVGQQVIAQAAVLLGAILYACAAIYGKRFAHLSPTVTATGTMIWASICLVPISLIIEQPWTLRPSALSLFAAIILAVFCTGLALIIYFRLIQTLGSLATTSQSYLRAGIGVLLGILLLGEKIDPVVALGLGAAILGVALINMPRSQGRGSGWLRMIGKCSSHKS